jgi:hypothetical protein
LSFNGVTDEDGKLKMIDKEVLESIVAIRTNERTNKRIKNGISPNK